MMRTTSLLGVIVAGFLFVSPASAEFVMGEEPAPGPNMIVIVSDDYGWPYYGFMQRYLRARQQAGAHSSNYAVDEEIGVTDKFRYGLLLPDDEVEQTPPLHAFLTPAMDSLVRGDHGQYFPIAHLGASICNPGLATAMTGLHLADMNRPESGTSVTNAVLPEFLVGFAWDGAQDPRPFDTGGEQYLTMAAGKWRLNDGTHKFDDQDDCDGQPFCAPATPVKHPFDRQLKVGGDSAGTRKILKGRLEGVKDFIDCARCINAGTTCGPQGGDYDLDSQRLMNWGGDCAEATEPRSFFILYNPFMPHETLDEKICDDPNGTDDFDRTTIECSDPLYEDSVYCAASDGLLEPGAPVPELHRCQPAETDPCCPGGGAGTGVLDTLRSADGSRSMERCEGGPCDPGLGGCPVGQECRPIDLSCACTDNILEEIGNNLAEDPRQAIADQNIYLGSSGGFQRKGKYLRFINALDRTIDEILLHLKARGLEDQTTILVLTDNGATGLDMPNGKGTFGEHGYRSPFLLYDPVSGAVPPADDPMSSDPLWCAGTRGCRPEMAQFTDVLRTVRQTQLAYKIRDEVDPSTIGLPFPDDEPLPVTGRSLKDASSPDAYSEGIDLRLVDGQSQFPAGLRACDAADLTAAGVDGELERYKQCLFGVEKSGSNPQALTAGSGWYVLAEIEDASGNLHSCKYYRRDANLDELYDLTCDPNEQVDLTKGSDPAQPDFAEGYCDVKHCSFDGTDPARAPALAAALGGRGCADDGDCGGACTAWCFDDTTPANGSLDTGEAEHLGSPCVNGQGARDDDLCLAGLKCLGPNPSNKHCNAGPLEGDSCSSAEDCAPNARCAPFRCLGGPLHGEACDPNGADQCGGTCDDAQSNPNPGGLEFCEAEQENLNRLLFYTACKREWAMASDWGSFGGQVAAVSAVCDSL